MKNVSVIFGAIFTVGIVILGLSIVIWAAQNAEIPTAAYSTLYDRIDIIDKTELRHALIDGEISNQEYHWLLRDRTKSDKQRLIESAEIK